MVNDDGSTTLWMPDNRNLVVVCGTCGWNGG